MTIRTAWRRVLLVLALCALAFAARAEGIDTTAEPKAAAREVLVMLRLPPLHFRPDAGYVGGYATQSGSADQAADCRGAGGTIQVADRRKLADAGARRRLLRHGGAGQTSRSNR